MDRAYKPVNKKCRLELKDMFYIIFRPDSASLNSRIHEAKNPKAVNKFFLKNLFGSKLLTTFPVLCLLMSVEQPYEGV